MNKKVAASLYLALNKPSFYHTILNTSEAVNKVFSICPLFYRLNAYLPDFVMVLRQGSGKTGIDFVMQ